MKLNLTILFCFLLCCGYSQQRLNWIFNTGSGNHDRAYDVVKDASDNIYVTGYFQGTVDFNPSSSSSNNLISNGSTDIFIAKYSSTRQFLWAVSIGGTSADEGISIALDASNNVYVTGTFQGAGVDFDFGAGSATQSSNGDKDIFLVKYDASGIYQSSLSIGSTSEDLGLGVAVDGSDNVYITGGFRGIGVNFNPSGSALFSAATFGGSDETDIFISKYNSSLAYQWTSTYGNVARDEGSTITIDQSDNIYVGGLFTISIDFDNGASSDPMAVNGGASAFVAKYSSANVYQGSFMFGGTKTTFPPDIAGVSDITTDGTSAIYITGGFSAPGGADFDPSGSTATLSSTTLSDIFVAKYSLGLAYDWAFNVGGSAPTSTNAGLGIALDATSNVYVTGSFQGTNVDFDPDGVATNLLTSAGIEDIFVAKYDNTGAHQDAFSVGSTSDDFGLGILVSSSGDIFVTGYFNGTGIDFDPAVNTTSTTTNGSDDIFIAKYYATEQPLPVELVSFNGELTTSGVALSWETATEKNNSHFEIEWSADGKSFEKIDAVQGAGTTVIIQQYNYLHANAVNGTNYYRLRQVDFNGQFEYTPVIIIDIEGELSSNPKIYPNPAKNYLFVDISKKMNCQIIDLTGKVIKEYQLTEGTSIDISELASGTYLIKIGEKTQKFVVE